MIADKALIYSVARTQYVRRNAEPFSLAEMVWTSSTNNSLNEYREWATMDYNQKQEWLDKAERWLEHLKQVRPNVYNILENGYVDIGDENV